MDVTYVHAIHAMLIFRRYCLVTLLLWFKNSKTSKFKLQTMPLSPFLASSRQPPVAASCSCCQPCSHGRHAGNIDCKTSRCSSTVRRGHSCERGSNEIPLQLLSIQLCQIYESIFLMLFSCHLWDFTDMPKQEQVEASFTCHMLKQMVSPLQCAICERDVILNFLGDT